MKFARVWLGVFAPSLVLVAAALALGVYLLEWLSREVNSELPDGLTVMVLTAVCNGLMLSLVVIAQSRMTPKDDPAIPIDEHHRLIESYSLAMAKALAPLLERQMKTDHLTQARDITARTSQLAASLPEALRDLEERRSNDPAAAEILDQIASHLDSIDAMVRPAVSGYGQ